MFGQGQLAAIIEAQPLAVTALAPPVPSPVEHDGDHGVRALLTDRRLVRVSDKKLVYSHIVGKAAGFLSDCCEGPVCERDAAGPDISTA